jgi:hypothetical protein
MKIFVSWSGNVGRGVAEALDEFIPKLLPGCELWVSTQVKAGWDWQGVIASKIEESALGILCLTRRRLHSPWPLFEAGALWKSNSAEKTQRVIPYLIGFTQENLPAPLQTFQAVTADRGGTLELVRSIASLMGLEEHDKALGRRFAQRWAAFDRRLQKAIRGGFYITGEWKYRCAAHDIPDGKVSEWGGTCEIVEEETWDGRVGFKLNGRRQWETMFRRGKREKKVLPNPYSWSSEWMGMTGERSLKYTYSIQTKGGNVQGYAFGDINVKRDGMTIKGKFYQLPPFQATHGEMLLKRRTPEEKGIRW